jgi:hypothetical protein
MVQTACALRSRIAAAKRWNNFEGIRLQRFGFGCARAQRFKMFFAATEQRLEFLLGAHVGLGRIPLIQTHGPSFRTPPLGSITRKPCFESLDLAPRAVKKFVASVEIFTGCNVAATLQAGRRLARRGLYNGTGSM